LKYLAVISVMVALASCAEPGPPPGVPAELRAIVEANRAIALPPLHPDFSDRIGEFALPDFDREMAARVARVMRQVDGFSLREMTYVRSVDRPVADGAAISRAAAAAEIEHLFEFLPIAWAGYQYHGGDAVFLPLRDMMLERLALMSDPLPVMSYLHDLLVPYLSLAIADNHFQIHDFTFRAPDRVAFMSDGITLRARGGGFEWEIDGSVYLVLETALADGRAVSGIKPTITREGEFAFAFGHLATSGDPGAEEMRATLECAATGERRDRAVRLSPVFHSGLPRHPVIASREEGGVLVVENRVFPGAHDGGARGSVFYMHGMEARDRPVAILDIRRHGGGIDLPAIWWIGGFAGMEHGVSESAAFLRFGRSHPDSLARFPAGATGSPGAPLGWAPPFPSRGDALVIPHDNTLVVLMDKGTSSAGELFVAYLRQLENALFVGTNTHGNLVTGGMTRSRLPYSGLDIMYGSRVHLRPDLSPFEGIGFMPDLWVPPGEALERALAFIERYGLNR